MTKRSDFDPFVLPLRSQVVDLPTTVEETVDKLNTLIAGEQTSTSDDKPFRGEIEKGRLQLAVRIPTSGVASNYVRHERALVIVYGAVTARGDGSTLRLDMRQPLPAFVLLAIIWAGFVYTIAKGASPALLMTPLLGHAILIFFFRMATRQRVLDPVSKALGIKL